LHERFLGHFRGLSLGPSSPHLLVAVSGGCDSVSLLHLLRFAIPADRPKITVAHLDHGMRAGSQADALWVAGLCRAWDLPLVSGRATDQLRTETDARRERQRFLYAAAQQVAADWIVTAHHADDQAETVLFRILRGTGVAGLGGIEAVSANRWVRPLLPFWREEIESHARSVGLRWREDPTNHSPGAARNRLRNGLIPEIERTVAPGARRSLVRLAELAMETEAGWAEVIAGLVDEHAESDAGGVVLARQPFRTYHPALGSRLLRAVLRRFGFPPSEAGTRSALQFISDAPSGRSLQLPGGLRISAEFDRVRISPPSVARADSAVRIPSADRPGTGELRLGGKVFAVAWGPQAERPEMREAVAWHTAFRSDGSASRSKCAAGRRATGSGCTQARGV